MLWDSTASGRRLYHCLLVLWVRVAINSHDRDLPSLNNISTLVAIKLKNPSVFHSEKNF
jgi:hypothetical protein